MDRPAVIERDDVLAQPTRARLFGLLTELRRPVGTAELARRLELRPNGIRVHLERLEHAGLVTRTAAPQPRGRPRDSWMVAPGARPGGVRPRAYADLGRWLARALPSVTGVRPDVRAVGRTIGRELAPTPTDTTADVLLSTLSALGFQPSLQRSNGGERAYCLGNCPYRDAAVENPDVICNLHRGITRGLIDVLEPAAELADFVIHDPDAAGCRIELHQSAPGRISSREPSR